MSAAFKGSSPFVNIFVLGFDCDYMYTFETHLGVSAFDDAGLKIVWLKIPTVKLNILTAPVQF